MLQIVKDLYRRLKGFAQSVGVLYSINWTKTLYFNLKTLPLAQALKLPVVFYGSVRFTELKGKVVIDAPVRFAMVGFGQAYELFTTSKKNAQLTLMGTFIVRGHIQFGIDYAVYVNWGATLEMGHLSSLGSNGKIVCMNRVVFGERSRVGFESQLIDCDFHRMKNTLTNECYPIDAPITLGNFNYIGNRVSIMKSTKTPDNCTVASNSVLTKDYSSFGENVLLGGVPCKLLRENICRDWDEEEFDARLIVGGK